MRVSEIRVKRIRVNQGLGVSSLVCKQIHGIITSALVSLALRREVAWS